MRSTCAVEKCARPARKRGWCPRHYDRWLAHGTPLPDWAEIRFWSRLDRSNPRACWVWPGKVLVKDGYGALRDPRTAEDPGDSKLVRAHRLAYELTNGPVPEGLEVDHVCHVRLCVNPAHLRLATRAQNASNRSGPDPRNTSGYRGVSRSPSGRFKAYALNRHLGTYDTAEEASGAASLARSRLMPFSVLDQQGRKA